VAILQGERCPVPRLQFVEGSDLHLLPPLECQFWIMIRQLVKVKPASLIWRTPAESVGDLTSSLLFGQHPSFLNPVDGLFNGALMLKSIGFSRLPEGSGRFSRQ
jgi:hypothetical protein